MVLGLLLAFASEPQREEQRDSMSGEADSVGSDSKSVAGIKNVSSKIDGTSN